MCVVGASFKEQKLIILGHRKMAFSMIWINARSWYCIPIRSNGNIKYRPNGGRKAIALDGMEPLRAECRHFIDCIVSRSTPRTDGHEGLRYTCAAAVPGRLGCSAFFIRSSRESLRGAGAGRAVVFCARVRVCRRRRSDRHGNEHLACLSYFERIQDRAELQDRTKRGDRSQAVVGNGVKIQNNVSVYEGVTLEDGVFCGPSMVFTNVFNPRS